MVSGQVSVKAGNSTPNFHVNSSRTQVLIIITLCHTLEYKPSDIIITSSIGQVMCYYIICILLPAGCSTAMAPRIYIRNADVSRVQTLHPHACRWSVWPARPWRLAMPGAPGAARLPRDCFPQRERSRVSLCRGVQRACFENSLY